MHHNTHPIVLQHHVEDLYKGELQYLVRLGLGPIMVQDWLHLPSVLLQLEMMPTQLIDHWQVLRRQRLDVIMCNVRDRLSNRIRASITNHL